MLQERATTISIHVLERRIETVLEQIADMAEALADLYMLYSIWLEEPHPGPVCEQMNLAVHRLAREVVVGRTQHITERFQRVQEVKR
jgi:hypothetical protein